MKRVIVIATYEAYVPEDMSITSLRENIEDKFQNSFEDFGVTAEGYHDEDLEWVVFESNGVLIGTEAMIKVSGD